MEIKKLLIIAKYYPPFKGARAIQLERMINALLDYTTINLELITIGNIDEKKEINSRLTIHRIKYIPKYSIFKRIINKLFGPIYDSLYYSFAKKAANIGEHLIKSKEIKNILTLSTPLDSHLAGLILKRKVESINWFCFFSDPVPLFWAPFPYKEIKLFSFYQHKIVKQIFSSCQNVLAPNQLMLDLFRKHYHFQTDCKFIELQHIGLEKRIENKILKEGWIIHSGFFSKERVSKSLFIALSEIYKENKNFKGLLQLGKTSKKFISYMKAYNCEKFITIMAELPSNESEKIQAEYPINIIIEAPMEYSPFIPSKFAEAIFTNKKIIVISPKKSTISLLWSHSKQVFIGNYNKESIKTAINSALSNEAITDNKLLDYYSPKTVATIIENNIY